MQHGDPAFWLAFETESRGELVAVASSDLSSCDIDDPGVMFLTGVALGFHDAHPNRRLVLLSDLTRWLASAGLDWRGLDVDLPTLTSRLERSYGAALKPLR
jgi:hypothetical protein